MSNHQNEEKQVGVDEEDEEEKWAKHYSSNHQILLVGEGDFSFSLSLANSFGSASNILASSLDPYEKLGASLLHGVDATKMKLHSDLRWWKFDRIIFNFPHAGFHGKEDHAHVVNMHRNLVHGFFHNAIGMLRADGEIHVNHKATAPFCHWNITELGLKNCLVLIECVDFKKEDYPGYHNKRGDGWRCDEPFPLGECSTFKFRLSPTTKRLHTGITSMFASMRERPLQFQRIPMQMQQWSSSIKFSSRAGHLTNMEQTSQHVSFPLTSSTGNSFSGMDDGHLINPTVTFGGTNHDLRHSFHTPRPDIQGNPVQMQQWSPSIKFSSRAGPDIQGNPVQMQQWSPSIKFSSRVGHLTNMEQTSQHVSFPLTSSTGNSFSGMNDGHLINPTITFGGTNHDLRHSFHTPRPAIQGNPIQMQQWSPSIKFSSRASHLTNMEQTSQHVSFPLPSNIGNSFSRMTDGHSINSTEAFGGTNNDLRHSYHAPRPNFVRDCAAMTGRTLNGDMYALREHHRIRMSLMRLKRLLGHDHQLNESDEQRLEYR
ncbi:heavy metal-associated isoprenylated plant protein 41 [Quercus suber]|uniref:Heavy metal-associated isoprenylated plant protein 41 n=1 Tax=Quercus suber TaxID=58331 RepID=A0AAW0J0M3_QUESU